MLAFVIIREWRNAKLPHTYIYTHSERSHPTEWMDFSLLYTCPIAHRFSFLIFCPLVYGRKSGRDPVHFDNTSKRISLYTWAVSASDLCNFGARGFWCELHKWYDNAKRYFPARRSMGASSQITESKKVAAGCCCWCGVDRIFISICDDVIYRASASNAYVTVQFYFG